MPGLLETDDAGLLELDAFKGRFCFVAEIVRANFFRCHSDKNTAAYGIFSVCIKLSVQSGIIKMATNVLAHGRINIISKHLLNKLGNFIEKNKCRKNGGMR